MKSDMQLQTDVLAELRWDPSIASTEIGVAAKDGVVTLTGAVDSYARKFSAERATERVTGVKAIAEELQVKLPRTLERTDTDIAHAALSAMKWDIEVPDEKLTMKVEKGWLTLEGKVDWYFQKAAAERAVRFLTGVRGVTNLVSVQPAVSATAVKTDIEAALKRSAELDSNKIFVETLGDTVVLKGTVRSWAERQDAERAAWQAPGVRQVDDKLVVRG